MGEATPVADLPVEEIQERTRGEVARSGPDIWERIRLRAEQRLARVEVQAHRLFDRDVTKEEATQAISAADALAKELGQLELPSIAQLARHISRTFESNDLSPATASHLASTTDDIRTLLESAIAQQTATVADDKVVVLGPGSGELDAVCWVLASRGYEVFHGEHVLPPEVEDPAAVVAALPNFTVATRSLLRAVTETWSVPLLILHDSDDPATLRSLAMFGTTMLALSTPPDLVTSELSRAVVAQKSKPTALICGEGDEAAAVLSDHGFELIEVFGPDELQGAIRGRHCAVVFGSVVDTKIVFELARLIRATPSLRATPLIWSTNGNETNEHIIQATRLDIFAVETLDDGLAARLAAMLRKGAADLAEADDASQTVLSWPAAQVLIDRALVAAHRNGSQVGLATINLAPDLSEERLDQLKEILAREFRRGDIVGARGDRSLAVALTGVSRRVATSRMASLMERLGLSDGESKVGVALFPNDGRSAAELSESADRARRLAESHGGPYVVSTAWRPDSEQVADALVVDADPVLGTMLVAALAEHGLRADQIDDGREALDVLTSQGGAALPKLLLLDLDTSGLDGLSLLRQLRAQGVLAQLNVLLMTSRSSESDLRVALDLGVADVITKPFSTTLLMHRIGRLLDDL